MARVLQLVVNTWQTFPTSGWSGPYSSFRTKSPCEGAPASRRGTGIGEGGACWTGPCPGCCASRVWA